MRRYLAVLAIGLLAGLAMVALARRAPDTSSITEEAPIEIKALAVRVLDSGVQVSDSVLSQGVVVRLTVENATHAKLTLALGGYEDRVQFILAAGATDTTSFVADRPGDHFPWLRDGVPSARLDVSGSHLIEGHR